VIPPAAAAPPDRRLAWVDACKGFAIVVVVLDHARVSLGLENPAAYYTVCSVALFTFLGGVTNGLSALRHGPGTPYARLVLPKLARILVPYAVASVAYDLVRGGFAPDVGRSLDHLLHFSADGAFYFVLFYVQLVAVAPLLWRLLSRSALQTAVVLAGVFVLAGLFERHTFVLPVHGGGRFLLGGSYFFVFALGVAASGFLTRWSGSVGRRALATALAALALALFFGPGRIGAAWSNPPNAPAVVYTLLVFVVLYNLSALAGASRSPVPGAVRGAVAFVGRHSLTIFLYHRLALQLGLAPAWYASIHRVPVVNELYVLSLAILTPVALQAAARGLLRRLRPAPALFTRAG
jgi:fucose 4-O-acetylase-like acetyltransferase